MVGRGWLTAVRVGAATGYALPGYQLSPKAVQRLHDAAARIYRTGAATWDGHFDIVVFTPPADRGERARLAATLAYLGYGSLDTGTWVAPRPGEGVDAVLAEAGVRHDRFKASHDRGSPGAHALVRRAWDLASLAEA